MDYQAYKDSLAPFGGIIGQTGSERFVLLDSDFNVLFETDKVWDKHHADYSMAAYAAMKKHKYDLTKVADNFFSVDHLDTYKEFVELRFKFKTH